MQSFKDTATGEYYVYEDDVVVTVTPEGRVFHNQRGEQMKAPLTLEPVEAIPPRDPFAYVPTIVSRWQGREAMRLTVHSGNEQDGVSLFDAVEALVRMPETPAYYRTAWDEMQEFHRDSPTLEAIAQTLSLTEDALDTLFRFAGTLRA